MNVKKLLFFLFISLFLASSIFAQDLTRGRLNIEEEDASPSTFPYKLKVTNGSLTDNADGTASLSLGSGSGDSITVNSSAVDTTANFTNDGNVDFTLVDGGAGGPDAIKGDYTETDPTVDTDDEIIAIINASPSTQIKHEAGGLEADVSAYNGFVKISGGATSAVTAHAGTDLTADLEEETHASEHAVGGTDTVFPADPNADRYLIWDDDPGVLAWSAASGYTNLTSFVDQTAWRVFYSNTDGDVTELALGASGTYLKSNGATSAPTFEAPTGGPTYREYTFLPEGCVLDDTVPPAITVIESTGTGTSRRRIAAFDSAQDEKIYFSFVMPSDYTASSSPIIEYYWYANDVGPNEGVAWSVQVSATTEADTESMIEDAADADLLVVTEDVNETEANRLIVTSGTLTYATYMDGCSAGDIVTLCISRDISDAADDLTSDALLIAVHLKIPRS